MLSIAFPYHYELHTKYHACKFIVSKMIINAWKVLKSSKNNNPFFYSIK